MIEGDAVGAVVLAGGASRRMGTAKAWLEWRGRPLLVHVVEVLREVCPTVVVVGAVAQALPELGDAALRVDDPVEAPGRGPLVGVERGLEALAGRGCELAYVTGCDAPWLSAAHVRFMLAALVGDGLVPGEGDEIHPLASVVRVDPGLARARALLGSGELRLREWARAWERISVERLPDPRVLLPCNDPQQWDRTRGA